MVGELRQLLGRDLAERLYKRGAKPSQEVDKVAIDLANEESRLADTALRLQAAEATLASLAGRPLQVQPVWPWMDRFAGASALAPQDLARLPDHKALVARVEAIDKGLGDYAARYLPSLDASVAYNIAHDSGPDFFGRGWNGALVLNVPIFDRLVARTDYAEQVHDKAIAETNLTARDWALKSDYEDARAGFAAALASARAREATLAKARTLFDRSMKGFRTGVLSANDLSLDEARLTDTELYVVQGWAAVHRYYARLLRDLGLPLVGA